jgi:hypothetical protein
VLAALDRHLGGHKIGGASLDNAGRAGLDQPDQPSELGADAVGVGLCLAPCGGAGFLGS